MKRLQIAVAVVWLSSGQAGALESEMSVCEQELVRAAATHNVPVGMLYAVGMSESGHRGSLQPYALNIDGRPAYEQSKSAALQVFRQAKRDGAKHIDVGCMQINHRYHGENFNSLEDMFDPAKNVTYAARFLSELKEREGTWTKAIARYHAGPNNAPAQKAYVCRVIGNMVEVGFGEWTSEARSYCGQ